jgi:hypothetical protein
MLSLAAGTECAPARPFAAILGPLQRFIASGAATISPLLPRRSATKTGQRPAPNCLRAKCNGQFNSVTRIMTIRCYAGMEQLNCPKHSRLMGGQFSAKTPFQISQIQGISAFIPSHSSHLSLFRGQNASGLTNRWPQTKIALSCGGAVSGLFFGRFTPEGHAWPDSVCI